MTYAVSSECAAGQFRNEIKSSNFSLHFFIADYSPPDIWIIYVINRAIYYMYDKIQNIRIKNLHEKTAKYA